MLSFWEQDDRAEKLKEMWLAGTKAAVIGQAFGTTKSAVIGRAHRMGLAHKGPKQSTAGIPKKRAIIDRGGAGLRPMKSSPVPPRTPEQITDDNARILELKPTCIGIENFEPSHMCGYIHGEPSEQARCGRPKVEGLSYCRDHQALCSAGVVVTRAPFAWFRGAVGGRMKQDVQALQNVSEFIDA